MNALKKQQKEYNEVLNLCEAAMSLEPAVFPVKHDFAAGVYKRTMRIPAGGWLTSKVHLEENFFELVVGVINILNEDGWVQLVAPQTGVSKAGSRKMGLAITECVFVTYHANTDNCKDVEVLENRLFKEFNNPLLDENKKLRAIK